MAKKKPEVISLKNAQAASRTTSFFNRIGSMLGLSHNDKRDVYDIYGYDESLSGDHGFARMYGYSRRQGIANRLTFGMAKTCWRDGFDVLADPDDDNSTQLVEELKQLQKRGLNKKLEQADILNRIGRFSVLLVGVPDGRELKEPVGPVSGDGLKSIYFKAFAYDGIQIHKQVSDAKDPRFGMPELYQVQQGARRGDNDKDTTGGQSLIVHWTRIAHLNENALDSEIEGMGALEPIFNRILDLDKACGGSAEAYFRNARGKIGYEIDKDFAASLLTDPTAKAAFDEGAEKFTNEWQDHTVAAGAKVKTLDTPHDSPLDTIKCALWEIAGYSAHPIRILTGEGSGQLAGSEDQLAMNQVIADRQRMFCSQITMRVLEILDSAGMIELDDSWTVVFPRQKAATEEKQAETDNKKADTLAKVTQAKSSPGGDAIDLDSALDAVGLSDIKTESINLDDDELELDDV